jgi:predicted membrane channel-forming protein YqfA (hemolysin III family)
VTSVTVLLISLVIGGALAIVLVRINRERLRPAWRQAVLAVTSVLLGFGLTASFGSLVFGDAAMPTWSLVLGKVWFVALGIVYAFDLHTLDRDRAILLRPLGVILIAVGIFSIGAYLF